MFKEDEFKATEWINLFKKSGVKYVIPVAYTHDEFAICNSNTTPMACCRYGSKKRCFK